MVPRGQKQCVECVVFAFGGERAAQAQQTGKDIGGPQHAGSYFAQGSAAQFEGEVENQQYQQGKKDHRAQAFFGAPLGLQVFAQYCQRPINKTHKAESK